MRLIPRNTKVQTSFYKGITIADVILGLVGLGLVALAVASNLPYRLLIALGIACLFIPLFIPVGEERIYKCALYLARHIFSRKKYTEKGKDAANIKNLSDKDVVFTDSKKQKIGIEPNMVTVFHFGEFYAANDDGFAKREFIARLKHILFRLSAEDMRLNYDMLTEICSEYEQEYRDGTPSRQVQEFGFILSEDVKSRLVEATEKDVSSVRSFLNNTHEDEIYRLDGYGKLRNLTCGDFDNLINEIADRTEQEIHVPLYKEQAYL